MTAAFRPPAPSPASPLGALVSSIIAPDRDLLALMPQAAYRMRVGRLGHTRRGIVLVNDPALVRDVLVDRVDLFAKNDLFTGALAPLIGDGVFIAQGRHWRRQRAMIEPAFGHLHTGRAFDRMAAAVAACEERLTGLSGAPVRLEAEMSRLTADIIYRVIFSEALGSGPANAMFEAFARFQAHVANVRVRRFLFGKPFAPVPQPRAACDAASAIRSHLAAKIDHRLTTGEARDDLLGAIIAARDPDDGTPFTRTEMIDQIAVFFLAGHETTASTLTWLFLMISQNADLAAELRAEVLAVAGDAPLKAGDVKRLALTRAAIQETLRLYPPGAFLPRVALQDTKVGGQSVKRGTMVLISPWIIHRHRDWWDAPDMFRHARFAPDAQKPVPGSYLPFGLGARACVGGAFAMAEAQLVTASLLSRFDIVTRDAASVRPTVHLTLRPRHPVMARFVPRRGD